MNSWTYLAIHDAVCVAAGAYLIMHDHPYWAVVCFFLAATTKVNEVSK